MLNAIGRNAARRKLVKKLSDYGCVKNFCFNTEGVARVFVVQNEGESRVFVVQNEGAARV